MLSTLPANHTDGDNTNLRAARAHYARCVRSCSWCRRHVSSVQPEASTDHVTKDRLLVVLLSLSLSLSLSLETSYTVQQKNDNSIYYQGPSACSFALSLSLSRYTVQQKTERQNKTKTIKKEKTANKQTNDNNKHHHQQQQEKAGSGGSSVVSATDSWSKSRGFESLQERQDNFKFFSMGKFSVLFFFSRYPFQSRVTAVARKRSRSFCQKCMWQVTAKHIRTLHMWL